MAEDKAQRKDFFISYTGADRQWAEWIAWTLEDATYTTVVQAWDFGAGADFVQAMDEAVQRADRTIAVLSPDYFTSRFTPSEWHAAFRQAPTGAQGRLIPIRVRKCEVDGLLGGIVSIDVVGLSEDAARAALLAGVAGTRVKPVTRPQFPQPQAAVEKPRFPGALPLINNIRYRHNPDFIGRSQLLTELRDALTSGDRAALTQTLVGLGGVGKTQLALEYVYRYSAHYDVAWWVQSEDPAALAADYAALATALALPEANASEPDVNATIEAVCRWLGQNGGWLLIFDNVPEPDAVRKYLPPGSTGHIVITSRHLSWVGTARALAVAVFNREESIDYLLRTTRQSDATSADMLATVLGDLPLALAQAAAYVAAVGITLAGYLERFGNNQPAMLNRGQASPDYPASVATTWEMAFQKLKQESPAAAALLQLCAFFAPDDLPLEVLHGGREHMPEPLAAAVAEPLAFDDAITALRRYALLDMRSGALSVHRLVQAVTRDWLGDQASQWAALAVELLREAFERHGAESPCARAYERYGPKNMRRALLAHVVTAGRFAETYACGLDALSYVYIEMADFLQFFFRENASAQYFAKRALALAERVYGLEHPTVARVAQTVGAILFGQQEKSEALAYTQRALSIDEKIYGPEHLAVAEDIYLISQIVQSQGDLSGALGYMQRVLEIAVGVLGAAHPNVATIAMQIGDLLRMQRDWDRALDYMQRALEIDEKVFGAESAAVAEDLFKIGSLLDAQNDWDRALDYMQRALMIDEKVFGLEHLQVANRNYLIAIHLQSQGNLDEALKYAQRALDIQKKVIDLDSPGIHIISLTSDTIERIKRLQTERPDFQRVMMAYKNRGR